MNTGNKLIDEGIHPIIIGSDEAGYGSMAGPLLVAAVGLSRDFDDPEVKDSKQYRSKHNKAKREALYDKYKGNVISHVEIIEAAAVDRMGAYNAQLWGHRTCTQVLVEHFRGTCPWPLVVIDGNLPVYQFGLGDVDAVALPKADDLVPACSMASIFAKVIHDRLMAEHARVYPGYGFEDHQGYVTPEHKAALTKLGATPIHRQSYAPVVEATTRQDGEEPQEAWMFDD